MFNKCQYSLNNNMMCIYNAIIIMKRLHVELHNSLMLHHITQYGSTVYIGIAMVYPH